MKKQSSNKFAKRLEQLSAQVQKNIDEYTQRRNALFADLVKEGETVQKQWVQNLDRGLTDLRESTRTVEALRQRAEKSVADFREQSQKRARKARKYVEDQSATTISLVETRINKLRDQVEDRVDSLRSRLDEPMQKLYGRLNVATSKDIDQLKRQINSLRIRITALKAA